MLNVFLLSEWCIYLLFCLIVCVGVFVIVMIGMCLVYEFVILLMVFNLLILNVVINVVSLLRWV